jgi:hypothetical protein
MLNAGENSRNRILVQKGTKVVEKSGHGRVFLRLSIPIKSIPCSFAKVIVNIKLGSF